MAILAVTYDTSTGRYLVQKAGSAQIADGAIISGLLASGIIGTVHLRDLMVTSAKVAAALITTMEAGVADAGVTSAKIASGAVGTVHMWPGAVVSSIIASGIIGGVHIFSGSIPGLDLENAAIISSKIASGIIGGVHIFSGSIPGADLANQAITSSKVDAGAIGDTLMKNAGILSAAIAADVVGGDKLWEFGVLSGKYASGSITEQAFVSGISIDISEISQEPTYRAGEVISAYQGVQFTQSGFYGLAKINDVDTMPAIGIAIANLASGALGIFQHTGRITNPNWDFSGYGGKLVFLGSGQNISEVSVTPPATSGECVQRLGKVVEPRTVFLKSELQYVQVAE